MVNHLLNTAKDASCFTTHQYDVILEKTGVYLKYLQGYYNFCKKALNIIAFKLGLTLVPAIAANDLNEDQTNSLYLADNKTAETAK